MAIEGRPHFWEDLKEAREGTLGERHTGLGGEPGAHRCVKTTAGQVCREAEGLEDREGLGDRDPECGHLMAIVRPFAFFFFKPSWFYYTNKRMPAPSGLWFYFESDG